MNRRRVGALPANQPIRSPAVFFPIDSQTLGDKRIDVSLQRTFNRNLLTIKISQKLACVLQVLSHGADAKLFALKVLFEGLDT